MKLELEEAAKYLVAYLQEAKYSEEDVSRFSEHFIKFLEEKYSNYWHPKDPLRGNGFRCLQTLAQTNLDPTLQKIFDNAKVESKPFLSCLPQDLTMWIDPGDVSVRAGNRFAPIVTIYSENGECPYADKVLKRSIDNRPFKTTKFYKARSNPSLPPSRFVPFVVNKHYGSVRSASSSPPSGYSFDNHPYSRGSADFSPSFDSSRQTSPIFTAAPQQQYATTIRGFDSNNLFSQQRNFNHGLHPYLLSNNFHQQQFDIYTPANQYFNNMTSSMMGAIPAPSPFDIFLPADGSPMYLEGQSIQQQLSQPPSSVNSCFYPLSVR